jgi:hypothetical protein
MSADDAKQLEHEVISDELKIYLTRFLEEQIKKIDDSDTQLIKMNELVNKSRTIIGKSIYVLNADDMGEYLAQEFAWHVGEMALLIRRLNSPQLAEFLCELVNEEWLKIDDLNDLLEQDGVSFRLVRERHDTRVQVMELEEIEEPASEEKSHPNIRLLIARMQTALESDDFAGVLHASASIFETLAKIVISSPAIENQTLKSFFDRYRKDSLLPNEILDYILNIYNDRNVTPLAGHGSTQQPTLTRERAIVLVEMTKAFVKIEHLLSIE